MAAHLTLQLHQLFNNSKSFGLDIRKRTIDNALLRCDPLVAEERNDGSLDNSFLIGSWPRSYTSKRNCSLISVLAKDSFVSIDQGQSKNESDATLTATSSQEVEFNRVNCIVCVLHESSWSFSQAVESLRLPGSGPEHTMAWLGKAVHAWHRHIAYPVTAVGHAAMLAAFKKCMPFLIPSPYSSERLDVVKQLKRTREMDDQSWGNLEDPSPTS